MPAYVIADVEVTDPVVFSTVKVLGYFCLVHAEKDIASVSSPPNRIQGGPADFNSLV